MLPAWYTSNMESTTAARRAIDAASFAEAFRITAANRANEVAVRTKDDEVSWTWGELQQRSDAVAGGLAKLGLERGQCIAIMLANRPEFHLVDIAAITVGATPFSIYQTYAPNQIQYVVSDAEARIIITEPAFLDQVLAARKDLPNLEHVILIEGEHADCLQLEDIEGSNPDFDPAASAAAVQSDDILTLIYTSGTTGPPKGVQLTHRNLLFAVSSVEEIIHFPEGSRVISWLPAAHIAERCAHHYLPIAYGFQVTDCPDPRKVMEYLPVVRPQWFFAVPRIWEKLKSGLETMLSGLPDEQRDKARGALDAAVQKIRLEQRGEPVPDDVAAIVAKADEELFSGLRKQLGFDEILAVNVGAAPTPVEVLEFFHAIGIPVSELWGMSETCGAGACNPPDKIKLGTVGPPAPGIEIKLAEDGEVLVRSEVVMQGYRNMPDKTSEAIDGDGWLYTGDIGEFDDDGYLKIVDRKKEIIINAAGKNMSPANIEATLKSASPLIGQAAVIGDAKPYNTALIVLDSDFAPAWAKQNGVEATELGDLARDEKLRAAVQEGVDAANQSLARVEQIKKFHLVEGDWEPGGDELTPTMKLKRKPIAEKYAEQISQLYSG
jgi:long-subunit acyl-CoA synthetase (AMP-forming)